MLLFEGVFFDGEEEAAGKKGQEPSIGEGL